MTNKQTAHIDREAVRAKIENGQPITKGELSVYLEVSYSVVRSWPWLPVLGGILFFDDFALARRLHLGLQSQPRLPKG